MLAKLLAFATIFCVGTDDIFPTLDTLQETSLP
jgi:hypothetical protein